MKNKLLKINDFLKSCVPLLLVVGIALGVVNLVYINKLESNIDTIKSNVNSVKRDVNNISVESDDSEVLNAIDDAKSSVESSIDGATRRIQSSIIVWSN